MRIQDPALVAAAVLSDRYVTGRFLPDKAIDLIDEAGEPPADRDRLDAGRDRRGRAADPPARDRARRPAEGDRRGLAGAPRRSSSAELADLREQSGRDDRALAAREGADPGGSATASSRSRKPAPRSTAPSARATSSARRSCGSARWSSSSKQLEADNAALEELQRERKMLNEEVTEEDVAEVVARLDGDPRRAADGGRDAEARPPRGAPAPARRRPGRGGAARSPTRSAARAPACRTPTGPSGRSCSSVRPVSGRPSSPGRSPSTCSTTSARWCGST